VLLVAYFDLLFDYLLFTISFCVFGSFLISLFDVSYFFFSWFSSFRPKGCFRFVLSFPADGFFSLSCVRSLKRTAKDIIASSKY